MRLHEEGRFDVYHSENTPNTPTMFVRIELQIFQGRFKDLYCQQRGGRMFHIELTSAPLYFDDEDRISLCWLVVEL